MVRGCFVEKCVFQDSFFMTASIWWKKNNINLQVQIYLTHSKNSFRNIAKKLKDLCTFFAALRIAWNKNGPNFSSYRHTPLEPQDDIFLSSMLFEALPANKGMFKVVNKNVRYTANVYLFKVNNRNTNKGVKYAQI